MKPKTLWIIAVFLFLVHLALQYLAFIKVDLSVFVGRVELLLDVTNNLILVFGIGAVLGLLSAQIPNKGRTFKEKFKRTLPLGISTILLLLIAMFSLAIFSDKSFKNLPLVKYDEIKIPENINCLSLHEGKFETNNLYIERNGNRQIQVNKATKEVKEFVIHWISDCEYSLTPLNASNKIKVKIVSVNEFTYECYVIPETGASKHTIKQVITIIN